MDPAEDIVRQLDELEADREAERISRELDDADEQALRITRELDDLEKPAAYAGGKASLPRDVGDRGFEAARASSNVPGYVAGGLPGSSRMEGETQMMEAAGPLLPRVSVPDVVGGLTSALPYFPRLKSPRDVTPELSELEKSSARGELLDAPARLAGGLAQAARSPAFRDPEGSLVGQAIGSGALAGASFVPGMAAGYIEHPVGAALGGLAGSWAGPGGALLGSQLGIAGASIGSKLFGGKTGEAAGEAGEQIYGPAPAEALQYYRETGSLPKATERFLQSGGLATGAMSLAQLLGVAHMARSAKPGRFAGAFDLTAPEGLAGDYARLGGITEGVPFAPRPDPAGTTWPSPVRLQGRTIQVRRGRERELVEQPDEAGRQGVAAEPALADVDLGARLSDLPDVDRRPLPPPPSRPIPPELADQAPPAIVSEAAQLPLQPAIPRRQQFVAEPSRPADPGVLAGAPPVFAPARARAPERAVPPGLADAPTIVPKSMPPPVQLDPQPLQFAFDPDAALSRIGPEPAQARPVPSELGASATAPERPALRVQPAPLELAGVEPPTPRAPAELEALFQKKVPPQLAGLPEAQAQVLAGAPPTIPPALAGLPPAGAEPRPPKKTQPVLSAPAELQRAIEAPMQRRRFVQPLRPEPGQAPAKKARAIERSDDPDVIIPAQASSMPGSIILRPVQLTTPLRAVSLEGRVDALRAGAGLNQFEASQRKRTGMADLAQESIVQAGKVGEDISRNAWGWSEGEMRRKAERLAKEPELFDIFSELRQAQEERRAPRLTPEQQKAYERNRSDVNEFFHGASAFLDEVLAQGLPEGDLGGAFWPMRNRTVGGVVALGETRTPELNRFKSERIADLKQSSLDYSRKKGSIGDTHDVLEFLSYFDDVKERLAKNPAIEAFQQLQDRYLAKKDVASARDVMRYVEENVLSVPRAEDLSAQDAQVYNAARTPVEPGFSGSSSGRFGPKGQWEVQRVVDSPEGPAYQISVDGQPYQGLVSRDRLLAMKFETTALKGDILNRLSDAGYPLASRYLMMGNLTSAAKALAQNPWSFAFSHVPRDQFTGLALLRDVTLGRATPEVLTELKRVGIPVLEPGEGGIGTRIARSFANPAEAADLPFQIAHYGAAKAAVLREHPTWTLERIEAAASTIAAKYSDINSAAFKPSAARSQRATYWFQGPTIRQLSHLTELIREGTPKSWAKAIAIQGGAMASTAAVFNVLGGDPKLGALAAIPIPFVQSAMIGAGIGGLLGRVIKPYYSAVEKAAKGEDITDKDVERILATFIPPGVRKIYRGELVRPRKE